MIDEHVSAIRTGAGAVPRPDLFTIRVSGPDRVRYLNGMLTNDVSKIGPGQGLWAVKASNKGRVEGVIRVRAVQDALLLDVLEPSANRVASELLKLIIMDDATLSDDSEARDVVAIYGPQAAEVLAAAGWTGASELADLAFVQKEGAILLRDGWLGVDGYELHVAPGGAEAALEALAAAGATRVSPEAVNVVRVENGVPQDGRDIDEDTIPLEARLDHALNFEKGCYIGQEVIARAHNLGGVKHILVSLEVKGDAVPPEQAELFAEGVDKAAGEITSVVQSPTLGKAVALGYVRVAHQAPGTTLQAHWPEGKSGVEVRAPEKGAE